jgi:hypothetical protein
VTQRAQGRGRRDHSGAPYSGPSVVLITAQLCIGGGIRDRPAALAAWSHPVGSACSDTLALRVRRVLPGGLFGMGEVAGAQGAERENGWQVLLA